MDDITSVTTPTASLAVASSTDNVGAPEACNAKDDLSLMVDYNDSTPLSSLLRIIQ